MSYRTDRNNNPTAMTVDIAHQGGLQEGIDYVEGDIFNVAGEQYFTARLIGDPIKQTIRVIDKIGFFTKSGGLRWIYIAFPSFVWESLEYEMKKQVIGWMYGHEGGTEMKGLFV